MSQKSFTDKWIHSSQDRLPGSFMNENHHTMTHVVNGEDKNLQQDSTKQSGQDHRNRTSQQYQQTGQNSQFDDDKFLSQEPKRSVVGTRHDDFQKQQSSWIDDNSDNYSRAKDQFPSAGQQKQTKNKPPPSASAGMDQQQHGMGYDPDFVTRSAFQSVPQPVPNSADRTGPTGPPSVPESVDSNRAIMNQPLVSGPYEEDDDIQPASSGQNTTNIMPTSFHEGLQPQQQQQQQGDTFDPNTTTTTHGFNPNAATTAAPTATAFAGAGAGAGAAATHMNAKGPLDPSGVNQQQANTPSTATTNYSTQSSVSPPLGRGKYKKRNSTPDNEYAAALPVLQSYVPYAQGVAARANNEARYEDVRQQQAATNRRYSLHGADDLHHGFSPVVDPNTANKQAPAPARGNRRRSSLAESITKIFRRNSGTK